MEFGTYDSVDTPCLSGMQLEELNASPENKKLVNEAYEFLFEKFAKIGGVVKLKRNRHDFGEYPSFEIFYPKHLEYVDEETSETELLNELVEWQDIAYKIIEEYSEKFDEYL